MTLSSTLTLAIAMLFLAATPGPGILLVTSQTTAHNLRAGFLTTIGIICADICFILIVAYGLASLAQHLQSIIPILNLFGGIYLIYLGTISIKSVQVINEQTAQPDFRTSLKGVSRFVLSGFLITLSNPKAILFYLSFLPAFVDLNQLQHSDVMIIMLVATITIAPTMMAYAWLANQAKKFSSQHRSVRLISCVSSSLIILVGLYMLFRGVTSLTELLA